MKTVLPQQVGQEDLALPPRMQQALGELVGFVRGAWSTLVENERRRRRGLPRHDDEVIAVAYSPDGRLLATAAGDSAFVWTSDA